MEVMVIHRKHGKKWSGWFAVLITTIFLRKCYLQYTTFLSFSSKQSEILNAVIVHASGKQIKIKSVPVFTKVISSLSS